MKTLFLILLLAAGPASLGCRSSSAHADTIPCTCGQPGTDFEGCAHPSCLAGERNPDNPDCVCGPLRIGGK